MVADMLETMVNKERFSFEIYKGKNGSFEVGSSEPKNMISLLLRLFQEMITFYQGIFSCLSDG